MKTKQLKGFSSIALLNQYYTACNHMPKSLLTFNELLGRQVDGRESRNNFPDGASDTQLTAETVSTAAGRATLITAY